MLLRHLDFIKSPWLRFAVLVAASWITAWAIFKGFDFIIWLAKH